MSQWKIMLVYLSLLLTLLSNKTSGEECSCGTWKLPDSYKGNKYAYRTVLCGHTINKRNKNKNCENNAFYVSEYNDYNDTLLCYKNGGCAVKEKCLEDKVEKNEIPNSDGLAKRCMNILGEAWSIKNCKCPDSISDKIPLKEWYWTPAVLKPEDLTLKGGEFGEFHGKPADVPKGYHSIQFCGSELNLKNRNFACSYETVYDCKKWNGTNPFDKPGGIQADLFMQCEKFCIHDNMIKRKRKCT